MFSPRWLFFYPGLALAAVGTILGIAIIPGPLSIGGIQFDVDTLAGASALVVIGVQAVLFAIFTSVYASNEGFLPHSRAVRRLLKVWNLERGLAVGCAFGLAGVAGGIAAFVTWSGATFGHLPYDSALRVVLPSATALVLSCQLIFGTFFLSILSVRKSGHEDLVTVQDAAEDELSGLPGTGADGTGVSNLTPVSPSAAGRPSDLT